MKKIRYRIRAHANLRHYLPGAEGAAGLETELPLTAQALLARLKIPESEVMAVVADGETVPPGRVIARSCSVELFPVLSGG